MQNKNNGDWRLETGLNLQSPISNHESPEEILVSYSMPSPGISAMDFLRQADGRERFYWQDYRSEITFAAVGIATDLMGWGDGRFSAIHHQAHELFHHAVALNETEPLAAPRLFGGFSFRDDFLPDNTWAVFSPAHFILPHYQLVQSGGKTWLTINALLPAEEDPENARPVLQEALEAEYQLLLQAADEWQPPEGVKPELVSIRFPLTQEAWTKMVETAVHRIRTTELEKVVLARVCELKFRQSIDINAALAFLNQHYPNSYRFLFEPQPGHAFLGATPELLVKVTGEELTSMALAGTIHRSPDPEEDEALGQQLLHSAKDRHEHDVVVMSLLNRLAPLTDQLEISPQPGLYKVGNIQHLFTPVRAKLHQAEGVLPLVELLHPTPALGGSPRQLAMEFIREAEPVPRGWYAAPVGWIDNKLDGAFAVAIRSASIQGRRAWLYAGAGIVADSDPQKEWEETALKFGPMQSALGVANEL